MNAAWLAVADAKGILGEAEPDAALDAVGELVAVEFGQAFGSKGDIFELDEADGPVGLLAEDHALVAALAGEEGLELVFGGVWR